MFVCDVGADEGSVVRFEFEPPLGDSAAFQLHALWHRNSRELDVEIYR